MSSLAPFLFSGSSAPAGESIEEANRTIPARAHRRGETPARTETRGSILPLPGYRFFNPVISTEADFPASTVTLRESSFSFSCHTLSL